MIRQLDRTNLVTSSQFRDVGIGPRVITENFETTARTSLG